MNRMVYDTTEKTPPPVWTASIQTAIQNTVRRIQRIRTAYVATAVATLLGLLIDTGHGTAVAATTLRVVGTALPGDIHATEPPTLSPTIAPRKLQHLASRRAVETHVSWKHVRSDTVESLPEETPPTPIPSPVLSDIPNSDSVDEPISLAPDPSPVDRYYDLGLTKTESETASPDSTFLQVKQQPVDETVSQEQPSEQPTRPLQLEPGPDRREPLGEAPADYGLQFLRQETVLLTPGDWQLDVGLNYTLFEANFTDVLPGSLLAETEVRQRILTLPLELRYGLSERLQTFLYVPFGWVNNEVSRFGNDEFNNSGGLGDVQGGLTWLVRENSGCGCDPTIVANFAFTAPTGESTVAQSLLGSPVDALGGGFWAASWNVLFIQTYDPVVVFYGFGSRHRFDRTIDGIHITPGDEYLYQLGVGFAVNESVTLSTSFLGEYITEPYLDGVRQAGLIREPMRLRFAATIANACRCNLVEPFVEIGMTDDAPSARIGMTWTY